MAKTLSGGIHIDIDAYTDASAMMKQFSRSVLLAARGNSGVILSQYIRGWANGAQGKEYTSEQVLERVVKYKSYFGKDGGVTLSGGEPLVQADFCRDFFAYARECGINTCLDTSGSILSDKVKEVLKYTDRVLLDIKYATDELYHSCVGCGIDTPLAFLDYLNEQGIPVTLRQVVIPTLNDDELHMNFLSKLKNEHECVDKIELLGFKKGKEA